MSQDKSREEFEVWHQSQYPASKGGYRSPAALHHWNGKKEMRWEAWQASRAAVVVKLPPVQMSQRSDEEATFSAGGNEMRRKVIKCLEAAGIKVAP